MVALLPLAWEMTKRDLASRYRGSILGILWSLVTPILMLIVYTFVFGVVFQARWGPQQLPPSEFALALFAGLLTFNLFAESVLRAPGLIIAHQNLVKKVVFPLQVLPLMVVISSLVQTVINLVVLMVGTLLIRGELPLTMLLVPLVLLPVALVTLGLTYALASIGVFLRDLSQGITIFVTALMFLSPIFYPIEALPENYRAVAALNPIAAAVEGMRQVALWGSVPNWATFLLGSVMAALMAFLGFGWFQRTKRGFADVL